MSDTRKIEEQTREELLKDCELSLEDLEKVSGGELTHEELVRTIEDLTTRITGKEVTIRSNDIDKASNKGAMVRFAIQ